MNILGNFSLVKEEFIIYDRACYRREIGWVRQSFVRKRLGNVCVFILQIVFILHIVLYCNKEETADEYDDMFMSGCNSIVCLN